VLEPIGALPLVGKLALPAKLAKIGKKVKTVSKANKNIQAASSINRKIDTLPEIIPGYRKIAEKVQDITSDAILNPLFDYYKIGNKHKDFKLIRDINLGADVLNISNTLVDTKGLIQSLIPKEDGFKKEVQKPVAKHQQGAKLTSNQLKTFNTPSD